MMNYLKGFVACLGMFSIIPVPYFRWNDKIVANMIPTFPLVGLVIGVLWYGLGLLLEWLGVPLTLCIPLMALFVPILSGCIHLDGFMDTADAILSRRPDLEERRRILKDPNTGAFAVIAVIIYFILQLAAVYTLYDKGINLRILLFCPVISRGLGGLFVISLPSISQNGYGAGFKKDIKTHSFILPTLTTLGAVVGIGYLLGITGLFLTLLGMGVGCLVSYRCYHNLQGYSGDLAGCTNVITEVSLLLLLCLS